MGAFKPDDCEAWQNAFPFISIGNGDVIACDVSGALDDPPIIYLDHEGEQQPPIAKTLSDFLHHWERIYYVGPDCWDLKPFIDKRTGFLNSELRAAKKLRETFLLKLGVETK